jgi:hypothetical protein
VTCPNSVAMSAVFEFRRKAPNSRQKIASRRRRATHPKPHYPIERKRICSSMSRISSEWHGDCKVGLRDAPTGMHNVRGAAGHAFGEHAATKRIVGTREIQWNR